MKTILTAVILLATATTASAEWGLYVSRNGKPWQMEQTYAFETKGGVKGGGCKYAAADLWRAEGPGKGSVTGLACQEYTTTVYSPTIQAREQAAAQASARAAANAAAQQSARQEQVRQERREDQVNAAANKATIDAARIQAGATISAGSNVADAIRTTGPGAFSGSFRGSR